MINFVANLIFGSPKPVTPEADEPLSSLTERVRDLVNSSPFPAPVQGPKYIYDNCDIELKANATRLMTELQSEEPLELPPQMAPQTSFRPPQNEPDSPI